MKKLIPVSLFATIFIFHLNTSLKAQVQNVSTDSLYHNSQQKKPAAARNFFKVNLIGLALNNYSLQYERALTRKISIAVSYRTMPASGIPFKNEVLKMIDADDNTQKTIQDAKLGNIAVTPELRFYLSKKGFGKGFYIAPFFRFATFKASNIDIFYNDSSDAQNTIRIAGKLTGSTGGLLFGVQRFLGRHIVLDMQLLGPHFGSASGNFTGGPDHALTSEEQDQIRNSLKNLNVSPVTSKANVNAHAASFHISGPWGGVRAGLSIGFRF